MKTTMVLRYKKPFIGLLFLFSTGFLFSFSDVKECGALAKKQTIIIRPNQYVSKVTKVGAEHQQQKLDEGLEILEKCTKQYYKLKKFRLDVEYSVFYDSEDFTKPDDKKFGKIVRDKNKFFQEDEGNVKVLNNKHEMMLNKKSQFIVIQNRAKKNKMTLTFEVDSLRSLISHVEEIDGGYRYYMENGQLEKFDVIIDNQGYLKIWRSYYREKMNFGGGEVRVITQMRYYNFIENPKLDSNIFSLEPYIYFGKKGEVKTKEKFKNYYILNQIQKL